MTQLHLVVKTHEYYIFEAKRPLSKGFITYNHVILLLKLYLFSLCHVPLSSEDS